MTKLHFTYMYKFSAIMENGNKIDIEIAAHNAYSAIQRAIDRYELKHAKEFTKPEKGAKCNTCFVIDGLGGTTQFFDICHYTPRNNEFEKECKYALYEGKICRGIFSNKTECKNHARRYYWAWL